MIKTGIALLGVLLLFFFPFRKKRKDKPMDEPINKFDDFDHEYNPNESL